jgi:signal transduction histidine kinase
MKMAHRQRIGQWTIMVLPVSLLGALLWFGIQYHREFENNLQEKYRQQLSNTASTARQSVVSYFEKFSENLINLSHQPEIIGYTQAAPGSNSTLANQMMEDLFNIHQQEIDALILMDTSANIIRRIASDTIQPHAMMCIGNPRANPPVPADSVYFSDIFMNLRNQKSITISCPVFSGGKRTGILRWMASMASVSGQFSRTMKEGKQTCIILTDHEGRLLTDEQECRQWMSRGSCKSGNEKIPVPLIDHYADLTASGSGKLRLLPSGCEVYAAWDEIEAGGKHWKLLVMIPADELDYSLWKHGMITYGVTGAALLIIISMFYLIFSTRLKKTRLETTTRYLKELTETQKQLSIEKEKRLLAQIRGQENERQRISRDLHDGLGQGLSALRLKWLSTDADRSISEVDREGIGQLLDSTIDEARRIASNLAPAGLIELGLDAFLKGYCDEMAERTGIRIDYVSFGLPELQDGEINIHIFRIIQEALSNAEKHGKASEINIQVLGGRDRITMVIQDNGCGFSFDPAHLPPGNGLRHISERITILGGTFELTSSADEGTAITIKIPMIYG